VVIENIYVAYSTLNNPLCLPSGITVIGRDLRSLIAFILQTNILRPRNEIWAI